MAERTISTASLALAGALAACAGPPPPIDVDDLSEEQLRAEGHERLAAGEIDRAIEVSEALVERTSDPKLDAEGLWLAAEARFADDSPAKAFRHYQELLHDYPYSPWVPRCEPRVYAIGAEYLDASPWPVFKDLFSGRERGAEVMREFAAAFPSSDRADDALVAIADYRFSRREYVEAADFYARVTSDYADREWGDHALFRRAECWRLEARGPAYDPTPLLRATNGYRRYLSERPDGAHRDPATRRIRELDEALATSELLKARFYLTRGEERGARIHLANTVLAFPDSAAAAEARAELEARGADLSINSIDTLTLPASVEPDE